MDKAHNHLDPDLMAFHDPLSKIAEAYKIARTNVEFAMLDKKLKTIVVTSSQQSEGKTVTVSNLAISYAQAGRRILLIDADLRRPSIHRRFGLSNRQGLTTAIVHGSEPHAFVQSSKIPNLAILTSGPIPPNPAEMLMSETLWRLIDELKPQYDMIFIDASPVGVVTDAAIISTKVDGAIFVIRAGEIKKAQLTRATELLKKVNAHVLGFILNGASRQTDDYYAYYYTSDYLENSPSDGKNSKKRRRAAAQRPHSGRFRELERNFNQAAGHSMPADMPRTVAPSYHIDTRPPTSPDSDKIYQPRTRSEQDPLIYSQIVRRPDVHFSSDPKSLTSEED
ncbi:MAG: polysaccharide biosynthesis tyrosine autokinase [Clostridia bacterium]|nr:polysaccharide biosynthesis tyrosine autokinase [Clostridia bacterium]